MNSTLLAKRLRWRRFPASTYFVAWSVEDWSRFARRWSPTWPANRGSKERKCSSRQLHYSLKSGDQEEAVGCDSGDLHQRSLHITNKKTELTSTLVEGKSTPQNKRKLVAGTRRFLDTCKTNKLLNVGIFVTRHDFWFDYPPNKRRQQLLRSWRMDERALDNWSWKCWPGNGASFLGWRQNSFNK